MPRRLGLEDWDWRFMTLVDSDKAECRCGFCAPSWLESGWKCEGPMSLVTVAGKCVPAGDRMSLAENFGWLPGALSRIGGVLVVGKTPGKVRFSCASTQTRLLSRVWVPILPDIYYTPRAEEEYDEGRCYGFDGSELGEGDDVFHRDLHVTGKIDYIHGSHYIVFDSGWTSVAPIAKMVRPRRENWFVHDMIPSEKAREAASAIQRHFRSVLSQGMKEHVFSSQTSE